MVARGSRRSGVRGRPPRRQPALGCIAFSDHRSLPTLPVVDLRRRGLLPRIGLGWRRLRAAWADPGVRQVLMLMLPALLGDAAI